MAPSREFAWQGDTEDQACTRALGHVSTKLGDSRATARIGTFSAMTASVILSQLPLQPVDEGPRDVVNAPHRSPLRACGLPHLITDFAPARGQGGRRRPRRRGGAGGGRAARSPDPPDVPVFAQPPPYEASRTLGVEAVPTALRVNAQGEVEERVVGWDREAYERMLGVELPADAPSWKPACASRSVYDWSGGEGLDELEDMFERGWTDGLPVVPPTPERIEAMLGGRAPSRALGHVPPALGEATLERVAACAVLAAAGPSTSLSSSLPSRRRSSRLQPQRAGRNDPARGPGDRRERAGP